MMGKEKMERGVVELVNTERLVPQEHLLWKVDKAADFRKLYEIVEPLYSKEDGRPSVDLVVLLKIVLLQHLDGIPSLRGTLRRAQTDIAYRCFLGYARNEELPHFSTMSYHFRHRFTEEMIEAVFQWVLQEAGTAGALSPARVQPSLTRLTHPCSGMRGGMHTQRKYHIPSRKRYGQAGFR